MLSFSDIFKKSFLEGYGTISPKTTALALLVSCLFALYIFLLYRVVTRKTFYSKSFNITLAGLTVITTAVSDVPLAVIVIGFSDQPYRADYDWAQEIFRSDRSLAEYYSDMSLGKFTFTPVRETSAFSVGGNTNTADAANDGVVHVTLPLPHDDWRREFSFLSDEDTNAHRSLSATLIAALEAADAAVDFAAYDANSDGAITTDELCPCCHSAHEGFFGGLVAIFHKILRFFAHLFGKMKCC